MKPLLFGAVLLAALMCSLIMTGQSLGEAAREAKKNKPAKRSTQVYDNSNLPGASNTNTGEDTAAPKDPGTNKFKKEQEPAANNVPTSARESNSPLDEDWRTRLSQQRRRIADLEYELLSLERDHRRLERECAWKQCRVLAGTDFPEDRKYAASKEKLEAKQKELAEARAKLDTMLEQAKKDGVSSSVLGK